MRQAEAFNVAGLLEQVFLKAKKNLLATSDVHFKWLSSN